MILRGKLIDGKGGYFEKALIEIRGNKIVRMETNRTTKDESVSIDAAGMFIMPGLIDAHVHLWGFRTSDYFKRHLVPQETNLLRTAQDLTKLIDAGFTSVRDAGSYHAIFLRNAVNEGTLRGPRIKTPRLSINQTGGHADRHYIPLDEVKSKKMHCCIADGPDECRRAVREQFREGADYIKICITGGLTGEKEALEEVQFSEEEVKVILEEAAKRNKRVAAHACGLNGIRKAVLWGVHMIEHGDFLDEEVCEQMVKKNVLLTPTLSISYKYATEGEKYGAVPWAIEKAKSVLEAHIKSFQLAHSHGVKMAAGTDFSGPPMVAFGTNAFELELMVKAGFSPMEAIVAATKTASEVLGAQSEVGTIEPGKLADIIIVDGNPLENIRILQDNSKITYVMKGGEVLKPTGFRESR